MIYTRNFLLGIIGLMVFTNNCVLTREVIEKAHPVPEYEIWNQEKITGVKKRNENIYLESVYSNNKKEKKLYYLKLSPKNRKELIPVNYYSGRENIESICEKCENLSYEISRIEDTEIPYLGSNKILDLRPYFIGMKIITRNFQSTFPDLRSAEISKDRKNLYLRFENQYSEIYDIIPGNHLVQIVQKSRGNIDSEIPKKNLDNVTLKDFSFRNGFFINDLDSNSNWISLETNKLQSKEINFKFRHYIEGKQLNRSPKLEYYPLVPVAIVGDTILLPVYIPMVLYVLIRTGGKTALG